MIVGIRFNEVSKKQHDVNRKQEKEPFSESISSKDASRNFTEFL